MTSAILAANFLGKHQVCKLWKDSLDNCTNTIDEATDLAGLSFVLNYLSQQSVNMPLPFDENYQSEKGKQPTEI